MYIPGFCAMIMCYYVSFWPNIFIRGKRVVLCSAILTRWINYDGVVRYLLGGPYLRLYAAPKLRLVNYCIFIRGTRKKKNRLTNRDQLHDRNRYFPPVTDVGIRAQSKARISKIDFSMQFS